MEDEHGDEVPSAPKLLNLAANAIIRDSQRLLVKSTEQFLSGYEEDSLYYPYAIPEEETEAIISQIPHYRMLPDKDFFEYFVDGDRYPTSFLHVGGSLISDETFGRVLVGQANNLLEVDLHGNKSLGSRVLLEYLRRHKDQLPPLKTLFASNQWMFDLYENSMRAEQPRDFQSSFHSTSAEVDQFDSLHNPQKAIFESTLELPARRRRASIKHDTAFHFTSFFPSLRHFRFTNVEEFCSTYESRIDFITRLLYPLRKLQTLELNNWSKLSRMDFLIPLRDTLTTLRLYNCPDIESGLATIMQLENLEVLDISQGSLSSGVFFHPASTLHDLTSSLPKLRYLDIANTNLCSPPSEDDRPERQGLIETDIAGLDGLHQKLDFLSVFHCEHVTPSTNLPAYEVCSELSDSQLLLALKTYMDRSEILQHAINEIYQIYRTNSEDSNNNANYTRGLYLILKALSSHKLNRSLQISGTAALFYAIRNASMTPIVRRRIVEVMLEAIENFNDEPVIVRNCCLSFCQMEIPRDVTFAYSRMVELLVRVLNNHSTDSTTPRVITYLLNSLACQIDGENKLVVGVVGAIEAIMANIRRKMERQVCDETMEVSWSFLWNITDETPVNCELFLKAEGMLLFRRCFEEFPHKRDLIRNIMGLIGNLAEVDYLRHTLKEDYLIATFLDLLDSVEDGIETSYNSAGVLAQLLSDGPDRWNSTTYTRKYVTDCIVRTISRWDMHSRRFINYRSFAPILRLVPLFDSPGSQIWSLWALANLTTTDGEKYCQFVVREGGVPLLEAILGDSRSTDLMLKLARTIQQNIDSPIPQSLPGNAADENLMQVQ